MQRLRIPAGVLFLSLLLGARALSAQTPPYRISEGKKGVLVSLDFDRIPVESALRVFSEIMHTNIVPAKDVAGQVTLFLKDVPVEEAFQLLLRLAGLVEERKENVIVVYPLAGFPARLGKE